jgi:hypothetical protein
MNLEAFISYLFSSYFQYYLQSGSVEDYDVDVRNIDNGVVDS